MSNYWEDNCVFESLMKRFSGNKYAAISYIAEDARNRAESNHNSISHSAALDWVVTGHIPEHIDNQVSYSNQVIEDVLDYLNYVDDDIVKVSVSKSLRESYEKGYLIYSCEDVLDDYKKSRIRVITNILYDKLLRS